MNLHASSVKISYEFIVHQNEGKSVRVLEATCLYISCSECSSCCLLCVHGSVRQLLHLLHVIMRAMIYDESYICTFYFSKRIEKVSSQCQQCSCWGRWGPWRKYKKMRSINLFTSSFEEVSCGCQFSHTFFHVQVNKQKREVLVLVFLSYPNQTYWQPLVLFFYATAACCTIQSSSHCCVLCHPTIHVWMNWIRVEINPIQSEVRYQVERKRNESINRTAEQEVLRVVGVKENENKK